MFLQKMLGLVSEELAVAQENFERIEGLFVLVLRNTVRQFQEFADVSFKQFNLSRNPGVWYFRLSICLADKDICECHCYKDYRVVKRT